MNKNYKLTFEEYFKNGSSNWEIIESEEVVKNKPKAKNETVPAFVVNAEENFREEVVVRSTKENVSFEDGKLVIKAVEEADGYAGGAVRYMGRKFGKGLIEVKAKFPENMPGVWPKMYLKVANKNAFGNVEFAQVKGLVNKGKDFLELIAYFTDDYGTHTNRYLHSGFQRWPSYYPPFESEEKLSADWHVFGYEQTDIDGIFYIDGQEIMRFDIDHPMFLVFAGEGELNICLDINRPQTEACDENTILPCQMEVEYIKFYEEV